MATIFGDFGGTLRGYRHAGDQRLFLLDDSGTLVGDVARVTDHASGGDDYLRATLQGPDDQFLVGDAFGIGCHGRGGDDAIFGADSSGLDPDRDGYANQYLFGDAAGGGHGLQGGLTGHAIGGNDYIQAGSVVSDGPLLAATLYGDAGDLKGRSVGGDDTLLGGNLQGNDGAANYHLIGDGRLFGHSVGGDDLLRAGDNFGDDAVYFATLEGDGQAMTGVTRGGDDVLEGGANRGSGLYYCELWGDAEETRDHVSNPKLVGGDDTLTGADNHGEGSLWNDMAGEFQLNFGRAEYGDDVLTGGDNYGNGTVNNTIVGDAYALFSNVGVTAGDDTLIGGERHGEGYVENFFQGDGQLYGGRGGDDLLIASSGTDRMFGDGLFLTDGAQGGEDEFLFRGNFGQDFIGDFRPDTDSDQITFQGTAAQSFDDLDIEQDGSWTIIRIGDDLVTLTDFSESLTADAFNFLV